MTTLKLHRERMSTPRVPLASLGTLGQVCFFELRSMSFIFNQENM